MALSIAVAGLACGNNDAVPSRAEVGVPADVSSGEGAQFDSGSRDGGRDQGLDQAIADAGGADTPVARDGGAGETGGDIGDGGGDAGPLAYSCPAPVDAADASAAEPVLATAGTACATPGAFACAGMNQRLVLLCSGGQWTLRLTCEANQRCDTENGRCADMLAGCAAHEPGYAFCDGDTVKTCGPDLVSAVSESCCGRCNGGRCVAPRCGDGRVEDPEECDDSNDTPADGCESDCRRTKVVQLAAGATHTCALFRSGHVRCWGGNDHGQLGLASNEDWAAKQPYELGPIALGGPAASLVAGERHTCALMADASVQCWGSNAFGQLGLGHSNHIGDDEVLGTAVSKVSLGAAVRQIYAGGDNTCVLLTDGSVRCWGRNDYGQLGLGDTKSRGDDEIPSAAQTQVSVGDAVTALAVGGDHTCALLASNAVRCWGRNDQAQLGLGHTDNIGDDELPSTTTSITMPEKGPIVGISAGGMHSCVHMDASDGRSFNRCWGYNGDGSLGIGWIDDLPLARASDRPLTSWPYRIERLACGAKHFCLHLGSQDLRCIGRNEDAQLGLSRMAPLGTAAPPNSAPPIDFGLDAAGVTARVSLFTTGTYHNCALLNTGEVRCWGRNLNGQLGLGYASVEPTGYVGGSPETVPGKLPAIQVFRSTGQQK
jgi:cysteine-rich repeat protein